MSTPGPGSYMTSSPEVTSKFAAAARFGFGSAARKELVSNKVPGPGSYSHKPFTGDEGPAFSCTPRRGGNLSGLDKPGPGAHNLPSLTGNFGPKYSATPRRGDSKKTPLPGPGAYNQEDGYVMEKPPKWGFGTSLRQGISSSSVTPGPGTYAHTQDLGKAPQYSMQSRRDAGKAQLTPGPGTHGGNFTQFGY